MLTTSKELSWEESERAERTLHYDYMIYALGSHLPAPINIWSTVDHDTHAAPIPQSSSN
jgi:hypothetical protein